MAAETESVHFKYVFVPWDVHEPVEERELELSKEEEVTGFLDQCKRHFLSTGPRKTDAQRQAQKQALMADLASKGHDPAAVESALDRATNMQGLVENIALLTNSADSGFVGVNIYGDDEASIKALPLNQRASEIAMLCGKQLQVRGDVFIARIFDNEDDFRRMDFSLAELSSSASWVEEAAKQARRFAARSAGGGKEFLEKMQQQQQERQQGGAAAAPAEARQSSPADTEKERGNAAFKLGDWAAAVGHYTAAVKLDSSLLAAYNNRALAYLKLGKHAEAEADCNKVLEQEPGNVKALLRRASSRELQQQLAGALVDYRLVLQLQPKNAEAAAGALRLAPAAPPASASLEGAGGA